MAVFGIHPIRWAEDVPGVKWTVGRIGQGAEDILNSAEQIPGGIAMLGGGILHPSRIPSIAEEFGKGIVQDFSHPLRHPGNTLLDALMFTGAAGAVGGRIGELGRVADVARAGVLPEELATPEAARAIGKEDFRNRLVNPITGASSVETLKPYGEMVRSALVHGAPREQRLLRIPSAADLPPGNSAFDTPHGLVQSGWWYSKDPIIKAAQKLVDSAYNAHPEMLSHPIWRLFPPTIRSPAGRIRSAAIAENQTLGKKFAAIAAAYSAKHADKTPLDHLIMRMVGEGTTEERLTQMHNEGLASGNLTERQLKESQARLDLLPQTRDILDHKTIVDPETGAERIVPVLKPEHVERLQPFIEDSKRLADERETAAIHGGPLNEQSALRRLTAPFEVAHGAKVPFQRLDDMEKELKAANRKGDVQAAMEAQAKIDAYHGQSSLFDHVEAPQGVFKDDYERERFAREANLFRVPYTYEKGVFKDLAGGFRRAYRGGRARVPGTFTNPFTAQIMRTGGGETNTMRLIAESYTEAQRYLALKAIRARLEAAALKTPESIPPEDRQLMRLSTPIPNHMTTAQAKRYAEMPVEPLLEKEGPLTGSEAIAGGRRFEGARQYYFPSEISSKALGLTQEAINFLKGGASGKEFREVPGYGWIDRRMLGNLHKQNPLLTSYDNPLFRKVLHATDAVNAAIKTAMLYLRPSYIAPNVFGNAFLNMVHQGALFPYHTARNYMIWRKLDSDSRARIMSQMGEGIESAAFEKATGSLGAVLQRGQYKLGHVIGKVVDRPFRINAFLYEANTAGFTTPSAIRALLNEDRFTETLKDVTGRANDEIINYERMGPSEEQIARRLILFYPFVKGATRYSSQFLKNHPLAAGFQGHAGATSEERTQSILGDRPPWAGALFPLGGLSSSGLAKVINPSSAAILGEPAFLGKQILNAISGHPVSGLSLVDNMPPIERAILDVLSGGKTSQLGHPAGTPYTDIASQELTGGLPVVSLVNRLMGKSASGGDVNRSIFPDASKADALINFLGLSGIWPRTYSPDVGQYDAYKAILGR